MVNFLRYGCCMLSILCMSACTNTELSKQRKGVVIVLNGTSAVGKTSIIRAFQAKRTELWLSAGIDNFFVGVLPPKFYLEDKPEHHTVMHGVATESNGKKLFTLYIGAAGQQVIKGMHRAIAAYANEGNNVIVDYIAYDKVWRGDLIDSLKGLTVFFVGVSAPLEVIEEREKRRATSPVGHARSIYHTVHDGWHYDMEFDMSSTTSDQAAGEISKFLDQKIKD